MLTEIISRRIFGENSRDYSHLLDFYRSISLRDKAYLPVRLLIAGFDKILPLIPETGDILDLGCGYGLLTNLISISKPNCNALGIDPNKKRIETARLTQGDRKNISFEIGLAQQLELGKQFNTIICCDVIHHIPEEDQIPVLERLSELLYPNGTLVLKEINNKPPLKFYTNYTQDMLVSGRPLHFRSRQEWENIIRSFGLMLDPTQLFGKVYPHILINATKP